MGDRETAKAFIRQAESTLTDRSQESYIQHAYQLFASACMADPTYADAFYRYGNHNSDLQCTDAAIASWHRALENMPDDETRARCLINMGWQLQARGDTDEAIRCLDEARLIKPKDDRAWCNLSLAYRDLAQVSTMVECARKAFEYGPNDIHNEIALAFALLFAGDYAKGFEHFEKRFEWRLHNFTKYPYPRWEGEADKTVFVVADQGLGDTLAFSRFIPLVAERARYAHLYVQPELIRLFQHAFIKYDNINIIPMGQLFPQADAWTTFVSLPFALGLNNQEIIHQPHIEAPTFSMPKSWKVPDRKLHIGIAWGGSAMNDIDRHRNIPLHHFLELYRIPGIQLYSFQCDARFEEMHKQGCVGLIRDMKPYIRDVVDTCSFLKEIDLVITCESALGHICATVDKECWIPYSYLGRDYRLGVDGEKKLWTPKHRVFRQDKSRDWAKVFDEIVVALGNRV